MFGADFFEFGVVGSFLYHFDGLLADVEANIFIVHAFASEWFFVCFLPLYFNGFFPFVFFFDLEKQFVLGRRVFEVECIAARLNVGEEEFGDIEERQVVFGLV